MLNLDTELKGQSAIVTGATGNIGSAIAVGLAQQGVNIVVVDIDKAAADEKANVLAKEYNIQAQAYAIDITNDTAVGQMMSAATTALGPITILVNNAGVHHEKPILDTEFEEAKRVLEVNLLACWNLTRKVAPGMIDAGGGTIINITSVISYTGGRGTGGAPYIMAKGGLNSLTHASARELGQYGIRVNGVAPAYITGPFYDENKARVDQALQVASALKRPNTPEEIANTVVFLASPASSGITGDTLIVSAGLVTR